MMLRIIELPPSTPSLYVPPGLSGGPLVVLGSVRPLRHHQRYAQDGVMLQGHARRWSSAHRRGPGARGSGACLSCRTRPAVVGWALSAPLTSAIV